MSTININKSLLFDDKRIKAMFLSPMTAIGFTIHNTANKNISSAEAEAQNYYNNSWKKATASNPGTVVHFSVDENGAYQTLPLNVHGWHASDGNGDGNRKTIAIEICRDMDYDTDRYARAEVNTMILVAQLSKAHGIPFRLWRHYDWDVTYRKRCPHRMFEVSPMDWTTFVAQTTQYYTGKEIEPKPEPKPDPKPGKKTNREVAEQILNGPNVWGNEPQRSANLRADGYDPVAVQAEVNNILYGTPTAKPTPPAPNKKTNRQVAEQIINGPNVWGNEPQRSANLKADGYDPAAVQAEVNNILYGTPVNKPAPAPTPGKMTNAQVAWEIVNGQNKWGNGATRKANLERDGYNYDAVQAEVNKLV